MYYLATGPARIQPVGGGAISGPAPVVLVYPYGIVVDQYGRRYFD